MEMEILMMIQMMILLWDVEELMTPVTVLMMMLQEIQLMGLELADKEQERTIVTEVEVPLKMMAKNLTKITLWSKCYLICISSRKTKSQRQKRFKNK